MPDTRKQTLLIIHPSLSDVVGMLAGMLQCGTCNGTGESDRESELSVVGCPDCVDGYQIPGLVVAARESGHGWTTDMRDLSRFVVAWLEQMKGDLEAVVSELTDQ